MSHSQPAILIVDDDDGHRELVRRHLKRAGFIHSVFSVKSGDQALDLIFCRGSFAHRSPDEDLLVILDIAMPGIDGIEVLRQIKSDPKTRMISVLILTTVESEHTVNQCYEYGCNAYIKKSVESITLIETIRRASAAMMVNQHTSSGENAP